MKIINLNEVKKEISPVGVVVKSIFDSEDIVIKNIILKSGDVVPEHNAPNNVVFLVTEGKGTIINNGNEVLIEKDLIISSNKGSLVSIKADKGENLNVFVIRRPID